MLDRFAVIELEASGWDPERDYVTEIAAVRVVNGEIERAWTSRINPDVPIPDGPRGITTKSLALCPEFDVVAGAMFTRVIGCAPVAVGAEFVQAILLNRVNASPCCGPGLVEFVGQDWFDPLESIDGFACDNQQMGDSSLDRAVAIAKAMIG